MPIALPIASKSSIVWPITKTFSAETISSCTVCATMRARTRVLFAVTVVMPPKNCKLPPMATTTWSPPRPSAKSSALAALRLTSSRLRPSQAMPTLIVGVILLPTCISCILSKTGNFFSIKSCKEAWLMPTRKLSLLLARIKPFSSSAHLLRTSFTSPEILARVLSPMPLVTSS